MYTFPSSFLRDTLLLRLECFPLWTKAMRHFSHCLFVLLITWRKVWLWLSKELSCSQALCVIRKLVESFQWMYRRIFCILFASSGEDFRARGPPDCSFDFNFWVALEWHLTMLAGWDFFLRVTSCMTTESHLEWMNKMNKSSGLPDPHAQSLTCAHLVFLDETSKLLLLSVFQNYRCFQCRNEQTRQLLNSEIEKYVVIFNHQTVLSIDSDCTQPPPQTDNPYCWWWWWWHSWTFRWSSVFGQLCSIIAKESSASKKNIYRKITYGFSRIWKQPSHQDTDLSV